MNKYNIFCILSCIGLKQSIFVSERDGPTENIGSFKALLRNITYKLAKGVICQTDASKSFIKKQTGHDNVVTIHNPVSEFEVQHAERQNIILNVGRLVEKKGQEYLIEAFSKLKLKNWQLVFLGDGPRKEYLEQLSIELGVEGETYFAGTVENVDEWLFKSAIFAFPSILEGFPNALVEAMSCGLPVVSFNCDAGPSDIIINGENGYLVDVGDVFMLSQRIKKLVNDRRLRLVFGANAMKIREDLSIGKVSKLYLSFCLND